MHMWQSTVSSQDISKFLIWSENTQFLGLVSLELQVTRLRIQWRRLSWQTPDCFHFSLNITWFPDRKTFLFAHPFNGNALICKIPHHASPEQGTLTFKWKLRRKDRKTSLTFQNVWMCRNQTAVWLSPYPCNRHEWSEWLLPENSWRKDAPPLQAQTWARPLSTPVYLNGSSLWQQKDCRLEKTMTENIFINVDTKEMVNCRRTERDRAWQK